MWTESLLVIVVHFFLFRAAAETVLQLPPSIINNSRSHKLYLPGDHLYFECRAEGSPDIKYTWIKNGVEIKDRVDTNKPQLIMPSATSDDEGFYQCVATNSYGTDITDKLYAQMAYIEEIAGPHWIVVEQKTVTEGQPFSISAPRIRSVPKPEFEWRYYVPKSLERSTHLRPSKRIQMTENGELYFAYAAPEDGPSEYWTICSIDSLRIFYQGSKTIITVIRADNNSVQAAPILRHFNAPSVALVGRDVSVRCIFAGYPEPTISWTLPSDAHFTPRHQVKLDETQLYIVNVEPLDEGEYSCAASNTEGSFVQDFHLRVEAEPTFHRKSDRPHNIDAIEGSTVTFVCDPDAKPVALIEWFQNGKLIDVDNPPRRFEISDNRKRLTIKFVSRKCTDRESTTDLMVIQCNASNVHGYAFVSGYLNVVAAPTCKGLILVDCWVVLVSSVAAGLLLFLFGLCIGLRRKQFNKHRVVTRGNQVEFRTRNRADSSYEFVRDETVSLKPVGTSVNRPMLQTSFIEPRSSRPLVHPAEESKQPEPECDYYTLMDDRSPSASGSDVYANMKQPYYLMLED